MAGLFFVAAPGAISVASAGQDTLVQIIAASNHRVLIHAFSVAGNGVTAADPPARIEWLLQTDAGTASSLTLAKYNAADDETLQTTAQHTATVEPTTSTLKWGDYLHPQTSTGTIWFPKPLVIPGGTRLGLRITAGTMTGCSFTPWVLGEE